MKDKTKVAFLLTFLLMSGVALSSCDNINAQENGDTTTTTTKLVEVPKDTNNVMEPVALQQPSKAYKKATEKLQNDAEKAYWEKVVLEDINKTNQNNVLSPEKAQKIRERYNKASTDTTSNVQRVKQVQDSTLNHNNVR